MPDQQAGAPRKPVSEQRAAPFESELRAPLNQEELYDLIAEAARERARKRGLVSGYTESDWLEAEAEVMTRLELWD
jgi:hypothetical protein